MRLYTASWCEPCKVLKDRLEAGDYLDRVKIIEIDEIVQELKANIGLRSVPTLKTDDGLVTDIEAIYNTIKEYE